MLPKHVQPPITPDKPREIADSIHTFWPLTPALRLRLAAGSHLVPMRWLGSYSRRLGLAGEFDTCYGRYS